MGGLRRLAATAFSLLMIAGAGAQDITQIRTVLDGVFALDHAACMQSLGARRADFAKLRPVTTSGYIMLDHAFEGHELACNATRYQAEIAQLEARQQRLRGEMVRLSLVSDGSGRDRSQALTNEIAYLEAHAIKLRGVTEDLRKAAQAMLELALNDLDLLNKTERDRLLVALDVQSSNDILCRMLGCPEPSTAL